MGVFEYLKQEEVFGSREYPFEDDKLGVFKIHGAESPITDFAILLGGEPDYEKNNARTTVERTGRWWLDSIIDYDNIFVVNFEGHVNSVKPRARSICGRPFYFPVEEDEDKQAFEGADGIFRVQKGEYPQMVADTETSKRFEQAYHMGIVLETGKDYVTDSIGYDIPNREFTPQIHQEYWFEGSKYIRFIADITGIGETLSDGREVKRGDIILIKVEPIIWFYDRPTQQLIPERLLYAGVRWIGHYEFLKTHFAKDIIPSEPIFQSQTVDERKQSGAIPLAREDKQLGL